MVNTKHEELCFERDSRTDDKFIAFCDAGFQKEGSVDPDSKHSSIAYVIYKHGPVHWKTNKSAHVCTSTAHAEATALARTIEDVTFLNKVQHFITKGKEMPDVYPTKDIIYTDNATIVRQMEKGEGLTNKKVRHWENSLHYGYEKIPNSETTLAHVPTALNPIDPGTKALGPKDFRAKAKMLLHFFKVCTNIVTNKILKERE